MEQEKMVYVDAYSREHWVTEELSRGGQGRVMRTREPNIALKLELNEEELTDPEQIKSHSRKYRRLRLLPIPEGLHITLPQAVLKDAAGYVMNLLEEMIPFGKAFDEDRKIPVDELPQNDWIDQTFSGEEMQSAAENYRRWYATGGSRRRLRAWRKVAFLVASLHGNGLVYCDFSMNNLFISDQPIDDDENVWLIDADNLHFCGEPGGAYTPGHCAPEIVRDPAQPQFSFASDSYAFGELLYECLTMQNPFHGAQFFADDDWDDPIEERIDRGEVPWIMDKEDDSNQVEQQPLETSLFLNEGLDELFERCFSRNGRLDPKTRPTMAEWGEQLSRLLDCTVACPKCGMHFCAEEAEGTQVKCPWCDADIDVVRVDCFAGREQVWHWIHEKNNKPLHIPMRAVGGRMGDDADAFVVTMEHERLLLQFDDDRLDREFYLQQGDRQKPIYGSILECRNETSVLWVKERSDDLQLKIEVCATL